MFKLKFNKETLVILLEKEDFFNINAYYIEGQYLIIDFGNKKKKYNINNIKKIIIINNDNLKENKNNLYFIIKL